MLMNIFIHNNELNHMNYHIYIYIEMLSIDVIYTYLFQA